MVKELSTRVKKAKLPSSNYSISAQKEVIEKTIRLLSPRKSKVLFLGKPYDVLATKEFSLLRELPKEHKIKRKLLAPKVMLSSKLLKEIFLRLEAFPLNRFFLITVRSDKTVVVNDRIAKDKFLLKGCVIAGSEKPITFKIDSRMFFFFKLNIKTITARCYLYVNKKSLIFENGRGWKAEKELYLMPRNQNKKEVRNEKANYDELCLLSTGI